MLDVGAAMRRGEQKKEINTGFVAISKDTTLCVHCIHTRRTFLHFFNLNFLLFFHGYYNVDGKVLSCLWLVIAIPRVDTLPSVILAPTKLL
jgi:hypothetical protein